MNQPENFIKTTNFFLASIVENSQDSVVSINFDRHITSWNKAAELLYGYKAEEVIGKLLTIMTLPEDFDQVLRNIDKVRRNDRVELFETIRLNKDGRKMHLEVMLSPVKDAEGNIIGVSTIARDITERKRIEQELKDADRKKSDFLAMLGHELRNPLTPIQTALHIITHSDSPQQQHHAGVIIERQLKKIITLVDDLLEISRITRSKINLNKQYITLSQVIEMSLETVESLIKAAKHDFILHLPDEPIYLHADMNRMTQILVNLLTNAIKYTNPGGQISLSVTAENNQVIIRVKDNGIGIPSDHLERIFELFHQIEQVGKELQNGLGIGLNLAKTLVEMHNGSIVAYSKGKDQGSEFVVRLPLVKERIPAENHSPTTGNKEKLAKPQGLRILVVDDEEDIGEVMKVLLEMEGHQVQTALTGESAIEKAPIFEPEAALVDIGLPGIDGYEVARRLRKAYPELLLIAHSGWGSEEDRRRSREAGFDSHLLKPADIAEIIACLTKLC